MQIPVLRVFRRELGELDHQQAAVFERKTPPALRTGKKSSVGEHVLGAGEPGSCRVSVQFMKGEGAKRTVTGQIHVVGNCAGQARSIVVANIVPENVMLTCADLSCASCA